MLTPDEARYLQTIPVSEIVHVAAYDPNVAVIASQLMDEIVGLYPQPIEIVHLGAAALKIAGQNDLDLYILADQNDFPSYLPPLIGHLGQPTQQSSASVLWRFRREGIDTSIYLTDPKTPAMARQLAVFRRLQDNPELARQYEQLKLSLTGQPLREYQKRKYEFYHQILGETA